MTQQRNLKAFKEYCKKNNYTLEKCTKPGCWLVVMNYRPTPQQAMAITRDVAEFGYTYTLDGGDKNEYYQLYKAQ